MKKTMFIVWGFLLVMAASASETSLGTYLMQKKIKSVAVEDLDLNSGLKMIARKLREGDSPREVTFVLSPQVKELDGRFTALLNNVSAYALLRYFFASMGRKRVKMLVLDQSRLAVAVMGEPFPGVPQITKTIRGEFMRERNPIQSLNQLQSGISDYGIKFPDVKMSFSRKRNGKRSVGILTMTGSPQEVRQTIRLLNLFYGPSFGHYQMVHDKAQLQPFFKNNFY